MLQSSAYAPSFDNSSRSLTFDSHNSRPAPLFSPAKHDARPLESESLLKGHKIVEIVHNGSLYKLQATKLGKLILTK